MVILWVKGKQLMLDPPKRKKRVRVVKDTPFRGNLTKKQIKDAVRKVILERMKRESDAEDR